MNDFLNWLPGALWVGLTEPFASLGEPQKRTYAPFLVCACMLASGVWLFRVRGKRSLRGFLFPKQVWLHPSAVFDYRFLFVRSLVRTVLLAPVTVSSFAVAMAVARFLWRNVVIWPDRMLSDTTIMVLLSLSVFLCEDFARYWQHRLIHRVPALWELHKVHHSAEVLTPLTLNRTHPLEGVLMRGGAALSIGLVTGVFLWLFPGKIRTFQMFGVYGLSFLWGALGSNLRHSHVWLSYGRMLEHVLISPAQHQIHHSSEPHHHDCNFGSALALWDWLWGTLYVTRGREPVRFGLPEAERNHGQSMRSALLDPLIAAARVRKSPRNHG